MLDAGATAGESNLYLHTEGEGLRFIAALGGSGAAGRASSNHRVRRLHLARVSAGGEAVAFVSTAPPSGYDNIYTPSGEPTAQVYLYDAQAQGGQGDLYCVSCNPGGGRPTGARVSGGGRLGGGGPRLPV